MFTSTLLALLLSLLLPLAASTPVPGIFPTSTFSHAGREYYLRTTVLSGSAAFDNKYVNSYHTGAGLSDAVLTSDGGAIGFLNDTHQVFDLGAGFPFGFVMDVVAPYAGWASVQINAGPSDAGFYFNNTDGTGITGLKWVTGYPTTPEGNQFLGWLVCNWNHGVPQLFWRTKVGAPTDSGIPCSCAVVELHRQFTS